MTSSGYEVTKKCPYCDTPLEFMTCGKKMVFTAHDDTYCHRVTRERVKMLEVALLAQREAYERSVEQHLRAVDDMLAKEGLPSMAQRAKVAELDAAYLRRQMLDFQGKED